MIVAIKGRGLDNGDFEVHEMIHPGFAPQKSLPAPGIDPKVVKLIQV